MQISTNDWKKYINRLSALSKTASEQMGEWVAKNGFADTDALIEYAYALVTKYGEGSAELACQMYDAIAEMSGAMVPQAVPAVTATYGETAKAINGSLLQSEDGKLINSVVSRLVKQPSADTMLQNAERDGAQFAWIPSGDTCAFCITLASRGWQNQSKRAMKKGHAEHIHANCDCQYMIRFDSNTTVEGYDPDALLEEYDSFDGSPSEKINAMRRARYAEHKDKINAQKRAAYAKKKGEKLLDKTQETSIIKSIDVDDFSMMASSAKIKQEVSDVIANTIKKYESNRDLYFSEVHFGDFYDEETGKPALFQVYNDRNKLTHLNINSRILGDLSLDEANKKIADVKVNLPKSIEEAIIHECGHAKSIRGKSPAEIEALYKELKPLGVSGVSRIAKKDGAEALAEIEVFISRGTTPSKKSMQLYNKYIGVK